MSREIKFRGQGINGEWYVGLLSESKGLSGQPAKGFYISNEAGMPWAYQVRPETIGQYTGLKDVNGTKIYEDDLLEHDMEVNSVWEAYEACKVVFDEECGIFCFDWDSPNLLTDYRNLKVVGNVFEHPELLKGGNNNE